MSTQRTAIGSESMLTRDPHTGRLGRMRRKFRKLTMISEHHPFTFKHFRSYPAMLAERQRHAYYNNNTIHPFSIFSFYWRSFMIAVVMIHLLCSSLRLGVGLDLSDTMRIASKCVAVTNCICFLDMIYYFNTGYVEKKTDLIVLDRRRIVSAYVLGFWIIDLSSSIPIALVMDLAGVRKSAYFIITDGLNFIPRLCRLCTVNDDFRTLFMKLSTSHLNFRVARQFFIFIFAVHCFTCLLFAPSAIEYRITGQIQRAYNGFLDTYNESRAIVEFSPLNRYTKGMFVAVSAFFTTGFTSFRSLLTSEIIVFSFILLCSTIFKVYTVVFALKTYTTLYFSSSRYQELMDQVEKYMHHQQFSGELMTRMRKFYVYKFQGQYYTDAVALGCLSTHLRNELRLYTRMVLVEKVPELMALRPEVLGKFMGALKLEVHMANDFIFHVGDIGADLYCIAMGTVAIYSAKGVEVFHLGDGDIFGVMSLVTPTKRRLTSNIAIEITCLYRMNEEDVREMSSLSPELYNHLRNVANDRMAAISQIDELISMERKRTGSILYTHTSESK